MAAIAIAIAVSYSNVLHAPFIWDDEELVVNNHVIRNWSELPRIFTHSAFGQKISQGKFYRPVQIATYTADYQLWGLNPAGFRLTNILIHFLTSITLLLLYRQLGLKKAVAVWAALLFAVHPAAIEVVTYISGRGDALSVLLSVCAFSLWLAGKRGEEKKRTAGKTEDSRNNSFYTVIDDFYMVASLFLFLLALLTKENIIILPLIMTAYGFLNRNTMALFSWLTLALMNIMAFSFAAWRLFLTPASSAGTLSKIAIAPLEDVFFTLPRILWEYTRLAIIPFNLHMEYHFIERSLLNPWLITLPLLLPGYYFLAKINKNSLFWLLWLGIALIPVSQVGVRLASTIREHWLYFPLIGLLPLLVGFFEYAAGFISKKGPGKIKHLLSFNSTVIIVLALYTLFLMLTTINRNHDWTSAERLYAHDLAHAPDSFLLSNNLGVIHFRNGNLEKAKYYFQQAIFASPRNGYDMAYNNLGVIAEAEGNPGLAEFFYLRAIETNSTRLAYYNLIRLYETQGNREALEKILMDALQDHPSDPVFIQKQNSYGI